MIPQLEQQEKQPVLCGLGQHFSFLDTPSITAPQCQQEVAIDDHVAPYSFIIHKRLGSWDSDAGQTDEVPI